MLPAMIPTWFVQNSGTPIFDGLSENFPVKIDIC